MFRVSPYALLHVASAPAGSRLKLLCAFRSLQIYFFGSFSARHPAPSNVVGDAMLLPFVSLGLLGRRG